MDGTTRVMPRQIDFGRHFTSTMAHCMGQYAEWKAGKIDAKGRRTVMGFVLPDWQRGLVWTDTQKIRFVESAWLGISLGTYAYNQAAIGSPSDYLLIDGQQRMSAIQSYVENEFKVFGYYFADLPKADERRWSMTTIFAHYAVATEDESQLRNYYNLTNFGGTPHADSERA